MKAGIFYTAQEAAGVLDISRSSLQNIAPELHGLRLPHGSRVYSQKYLAGLWNYLPLAGPRRLSVPARHLARSKEASDMIADGEQSFEKVLAEHTQIVRPNNRDDQMAAIYLRDLADILQLGYTTLAGWERDGSLTAERVGSARYIAETVLRETLVWQRPVSFNTLDQD